MRALRTPKYTVAEYQSWEGDWELIDGIPWAMAPSPLRIHSRAAVKLVNAISNGLKSSNCKECEVLLDLDWIVDNHTVLRPDIAVTCNDDGNFITKPPALIVEIASPSTVLKDRNVKFEIYEEHHVPYYIMVNPESQQVEVFEYQNGHYTLTHNTEFTFTDGCSISIDFNQTLQNLD